MIRELRLIIVSSFKAGSKDTYIKHENELSVVVVSPATHTGGFCLFREYKVVRTTERDISSAI